MVSEGNTSLDAPGSDICVWFDDLPTATSNALWEKHKKSLAFPAPHPLRWLKG